jgi:hypothetical protein
MLPLRCTSRDTVAEPSFAIHENSRQSLNQEKNSCLYRMRQKSLQQNLATENRNYLCSCNDIGHKCLTKDPMDNLQKFSFFSSACSIPLVDFLTQSLGNRPSSRYTAPLLNRLQSHRNSQRHLLDVRAHRSSQPPTMQSSKRQSGNETSNSRTLEWSARFRPADWIVRTSQSHFKTDGNLVGNPWIVKENGNRVPKNEVGCCPFYCQGVTSTNE